MTRSDEWFRPSQWDDNVDHDVWSDTAVGGDRLTWRELCEHQREELGKLRALAQVLSDLDRCEHGRHQGDDCSGCGGPSRGNPHAPEGEVIGYSLGGVQVIVQPPRKERSVAQAWYKSPEEGE